MDLSPTYIWVAYFWSSIKGNGPEALVQAALTGALAIALWPFARKIFRNEMKKLHGEMNGVEHELEKVFPDLLKPFRWMKSKVVSHD